MAFRLVLCHECDGSGTGYPWLRLPVGGKKGVEPFQGVVLERSERMTGKQRQGLKPVLEQSGGMTLPVTLSEAKSLGRWVFEILRCLRQLRMTEMG